MKKKSENNRREFLKAAGLISLAPVSLSPFDFLSNQKTGAKGINKANFELGVASWGLRKLDFEEVIQAMKDMQIKNISLKSMHLPFEFSADELENRIEKMRAEGLNPYAPGVVYMKTKEEADRAFEYTKNAGLGMIVGVPYYDILDYVEEKIKNYDIQVAIHCHGPDNLPYPSPVDAYERIQNRDERLGICVDVAHVVRSGLNPSEQIRMVKDRILDMHIWDVSEASKEGKAVRPGKGALDFEEVLKTLVDIGYSGYLSIEYGSEPENPVPACIETKGYINGILSTI